MLARDIALNAKEVVLDKDLLSIIVNRIIKELANENIVEYNSRK